jgi:hypothetical protein
MFCAKELLRDVHENCQLVLVDWKTSLPRSKHEKLWSMAQISNSVIAKLKTTSNNFNLINIKVHHQTIAFYEHNTDASIVSYQQICLVT